MTRAVQELSQIPFSELIGAPMTASIEAQALAAQSTVEFIQKIGFKTDQDLEPENMLFEDMNADADAGDLRYVTFRYEKLDENDDETRFSLTVPLLSIVPIPNLQIDEVSIDFSAKLTDKIVRTTKSGFQLQTDATGKYGGFWSPVKASFRVSATYSRQSAVASMAQREYRMEVQVRASQAPMPAGMSRVLDILEDAISDKPDSTP